MDASIKFTAVGEIVRHDPGVVLSAQTWRDKNQNGNSGGKGVFCLHTIFAGALADVVPFAGLIPAKREGKEKARHCSPKRKPRILISGNGNH